MLLSTSASLGFGRSSGTNTTVPRLQELELYDSRELSLRHRRVELDDRHQHVEQPDRRLHDQRREPRRHRHALSRSSTSSTAPAWRTPPSAASPSRRTTSCATTRSSCRTASRSTRNRHSLTFGASLEKYNSENVFFPGKQSAYVYNSLADFYTDLNGYLANPNRTTSPVSLRRFQVRYSNIPGQEKPIQPLAGVVHRRLRPGRVAAEVERHADGRPPDGRAVLRRHGVSQRERRRADVPGRNRRGGAGTRAASCPIRSRSGRLASASTGT